MKQLKLLSKLEVLILTILGCANSLPYFLSTNYHRIIYFVSYGLILYVTTLKNFNVRKINNKTFIRYFIFLWMLLVPYIVGFGVYSNRYLYLSGLLIYPLIYKKTNINVIRSTIKCLIIISCIVSIQTLIALQKNPYASRMADTIYNLQVHGVGSYTFIYSISLGSVIIFSILVNRPVRKKNILLIMIMCLYIITIIKSHFLTAILIVILGNIMAILVKPRRKIYILFISGILIIIYSVLPLIFRFFLYDYIGENGRLSFLFVDSNSSIFYSIFNEFVADRLPTLIKTFETIKKYPLTGIILQSNSYEDIVYGQHSTILDTIALWGIPVGCIYIGLIFIPFWNYLKKKKIKYVLPLMSSFFVLAVFNNIECSIAFVFIFIGIYVIENKD